MNQQQDSTLLFIQTWVEKKGWNQIVEEAYRFVKASPINRLSPNQLNRLRKKFHEAEDLEAITEFIDKQAERDEKRGGTHWAKVAPVLKEQLTHLFEQRENLMKEIVKFSDKKHLPQLKTEIEAFFGTQYENQRKQFERYLAREFFTAVYAICRCKKKKITVRIEEVS